MRDCTLVAFSKALRRHERELVLLLGHDGRDICFPTLPPPQCFRGYHIQEWIDVCHRLGYSLVVIDKICKGSPNGAQIREYEMPDGRFGAWLARYPGVLFGQMSGVGHAEAHQPEKPLPAMKIFAFAALIPIDVP